MKKIVVLLLFVFSASGCTPRMSLHDVKETGAIKQSPEQIKELVGDQIFRLVSWEKSYQADLLFNKAGTIRAKGQDDKKEVGGHWKINNNKLCIRIPLWDMKTCYDLWSVDRLHYLFVTDNALEYTMEVDHRSPFLEVTREQRILLKTRKCPNCNLAGLDLKGADLHNADLSGADLSGANLELANLAGADLTGATLVETRLTDSLCRKANFTGANLTRANMHWGDYSRANFTDANLTGAYLVKANFFAADFTRANMADVDQQRTFFEGATGLDPDFFAKPESELKTKD